LAESVAELHSELNYFYEYCEKWNLKVNTNKSKVMVFFKEAFSARLILFFLKDPVL
jgi:hypothetical protein